MLNEQPVRVEIRRGSIVEAIHYGALIAVEPNGQIRAQLGDGDWMISTRSTIKPIQAIPLVAGGAADCYQFSSRDLAVACASHNGESIHTDTVASMLERIGLEAGALLCGAHRPYDEATAHRLEKEGRPFTTLHNNCSGKHAGMLAAAAHRGLPVETYISPTHPVQLAILEAFIRLADLKNPVPVATDGCSAPTFGVSLRALALAFARLVGGWDAAFPGLREAAARIISAMTSHPELVGGTRGRLDSDLIRTAGGRLISKIGAEAVYAIGVRPCDRYPRGLGIAIKIADGGSRSLAPVVVEALRQLEILSEGETAALHTYHRPALTNWRGLHVGEVRTLFTLKPTTA